MGGENPGERISPPPPTTAQAQTPVLVALTAHNWFAQGCRLTAGCYRFRLPSLHYRSGSPPYRADEQSGSSRRYRPASHRLTGGAAASADRLGQPCAKLMNSGFRPAATAAANSFPGTGSDLPVSCPRHMCRVGGFPAPPKNRVRTDFKKKRGRAGGRRSARSASRPKSTPSPKTA